MEALELDDGRCLSPSDLSYELQMPLSNVNYHVTELFHTGLLELVGERPVRGATEHFYRPANGNGHRGSASGARELEAAISI